MYLLTLRPFPLTREMRIRVIEKGKEKKRLCLLLLLLLLLPSATWFPFRACSLQRKKMKFTSKTTTNSVAAPGLLDGSPFQGTFYYPFPSRQLNLLL
jgi:hypothetical protein